MEKEQNDLINENNFLRAENTDLKKQIKKHENTLKNLKFEFESCKLFVVL